ncbi:MAG: phosphate regulon sensor histidine kinase PhoR [Hoeflea sp.]|uniref:phosphate regulon sensor histidine kinase PhoR n=1 Tax=Hoeflea sp. TaxID=1940281 RepID=UPI0032EBAFA7
MVDAIDNTAADVPQDSLASRIITYRRPLVVAAVIALLSTMAGLKIWQALLGYGVFSAALLVWPASRAAARAKSRGSSTSARRLELQIIDALDFPTILFNEDTVVIRQNTASATLVGAYPDRAALSARIRSPVILELVGRVIETGQPESVEHVERVPSERWHEVRVAPVDGRGEAGEQVFVLTFRDMTEARRMDRMRTDFVANASHELRTPLASLMGFIETMQGPARDDEAARTRFFGIMLDQAQRMARLIDDLLSLSRLELRAHVAPQGEVDLCHTVAHVVDTLRPMADELEVQIAFSAPETPVLISGDEDELIQVFSNLIENACKYGQSGKKVEIAISETTTHGAEITIRDYGPGIAKEHVPRLTERFYRVDVETSRSKKGTGLGLAIVKHILTRHRARLVIRSKVGEGSTFSVKFSGSNRGVPSSDVELYQ